MDFTVPRHDSLLRVSRAAITSFQAAEGRSEAARTIGIYWLCLGICHKVLTLTSHGPWCNYIVTANGRGGREIQTLFMSTLCSFQRHNFIIKTKGSMDPYVAHTPWHSMSLSSLRVLHCFMPLNSGCNLTLPLSPGPETHRLKRSYNDGPVFLRLRYWWRDYLQYRGGCVMYLPDRGTRGPSKACLSIC